MTNYSNLKKQISNFLRPFILRIASLQTTVLQLFQASQRDRDKRRKNLRHDADFSVLGQIL